jgi:hypothetical protein
LFTIKENDYPMYLMGNHFVVSFLIRKTIFKTGIAWIEKGRLFLNQGLLWIVKG